MLLISYETLSPETFMEYRVVYSIMNSMRPYRDLSFEIENKPLFLSLFMLKYNLVSFSILDVRQVGSPNRSNFTWSKSKRTITVTHYIFFFIQIQFELKLIIMF